MANNTTPFGLIPRKKIGSGPYNGGIKQFSVPASDATAIFVGDLVKEVRRCLLGRRGGLPRRYS